MTEVLGGPLQVFSLMDSSRLIKDKYSEGLT